MSVSVDADKDIKDIENEQNKEFKQIKMQRGIYFT